MVNLIANPLVLRAAVLFLCGAIAFVLGMILIRHVRKSLTAENDLHAVSNSPDGLPLHLYNTVIQQLKQQKHELHVQSQAEQQRARLTETFSQAVLTNLCSGVVVFGPNGLVKSSNPAAKEILGITSISGMSPQNIFRGALVRQAVNPAKANAPGAKQAASISSLGDEPETAQLVDEIEAVLHGGSKRRQVEADYQTPSGARRFLSLTVSAIPADDDNPLGVACLITDLTQMDTIRQQQELQSEISAEMALRLRTSLTTIAGYAQQLANNRDPDLASQLASDIAQEAAQLDRSIGGFLSEKRSTASA